MFRLGGCLPIESQASSFKPDVASNPMRKNVPKKTARPYACKNYPCSLLDAFIRLSEHRPCRQDICPPDVLFPSWRAFDPDHHARDAARREPRVAAAREKCTHARTAPVVHHIQHAKARNFR